MLSVAEHFAFSVILFHRFVQEKLVGQLSVHLGFAPFVFWLLTVHVSTGRCRSQIRLVLSNGKIAFHSFPTSVGKNLGCDIAKERVDGWQMTSLTSIFDENKKMQTCRAQVSAKNSLYRKHIFINEGNQCQGCNYNVTIIDN